MSHFLGVPGMTLETLAVGWHVHSHVGRLAHLLSASALVIPVGQSHNDSTAVAVPLVVDHLHTIAPQTAAVGVSNDKVAVAQEAAGLFLSSGYRQHVVASQDPHLNRPVAVALIRIVDVHVGFS